MEKILSRFSNNQEGSVMVYLALLLFVFVGFLALSIDTGHWFAVDNELQNAADSLALAATRAYYPYDTSVVAVPPDPGAAATAVSNYQTDNPADTRTLITASNDQYGIWDYINRTLLPWYWPIESGASKGPAVSLEFRKQTGLNEGPVQNFFGTIFNHPTTDLQGQAIAALSGVGRTLPGEVDFPIAVGDSYARLPALTEITLYPSISDSGAWTGFNLNPIPRNLLDIINGVIKVDPLYAQAGSPIELNNGVEASVFNGLGQRPGLLELWQAKQAAGVDWIIHVPIVRDDANYVQTRDIMGFATFRIIDIIGPPDKVIKVERLDGQVSYGSGGGGRYYGTMSVQPKLVH